MQNFVIELNLESLITDWFTLGIASCLIFHLVLTKQKRLVSFCVFLVAVQFLNWQLSPWLMEHTHGRFLWYITWMVTDVMILLYVAYQAVSTKLVLKEELAVTVFTMIAIGFNIGRYIERHFTEFDFIKSIQGYALPAVNFCILLALFLPIVKQLAVATGKYLNGITLFGFRFSVSRVHTQSALAETKSSSKREIL